MNFEAPAIAAYWPWHMAVKDDTYRRWQEVLTELFGQRALAIFLELPEEVEKQLLDNIDFLIEITNLRSASASD
jgi:hypothetical protein